MRLDEVIDILGSDLRDVQEGFAKKESVRSDSSSRAASPALPSVLRGYSIDSRTVRENDLFFAIRGETHDGHDFIAEALNRGATAVVADHQWAASEVGKGLLESDTAKAGRFILVDDTLAALQRLAHRVVRTWRGRLVAVTGSAGKTTTKDLIAALLSPSGRVMKTQGNLNNAYGLPLSILRMETDGARAEDFDYGVFEMGMNHAGELTELTRIAPPDLAVVTNVSAAHLEHFASVDAIADAKAELVLGLKSGGTAILNADDSRVARMRDLRSDITFRTYGIEQKADVTARDIDSDGLSGTGFMLNTPTGETRVRLPLVGKHNLYNALAAAAVADFYNVPSQAVVAAFADVKSPRMRGEVLRFVEGFTVIDDSYNSNPRALVEMVSAMSASDGFKRKIVVAGEMLEPGGAGPELHREAGEKIAALGIDLLLGVRGLAKELVAGARNAGLSERKAVYFESPVEAGDYLVKEAVAGDLILVKGSRGVKTEVVVEKIKEKSSIVQGP